MRSARGMLRRLRKWEKDEEARVPAPKAPAVLFGDIKERVRQSLVTKTYDVRDFYHKTGIWQRIARSPTFETLTLNAVALNTVWMGIDMDFHSSATGAPGAIFPLVENAFVAFFTFEWFVRFQSFRRKRDGLGDTWFLFDSFLVFSMLLEIAVMALTADASGVGAGLSILRLARLLRLSRVARMVRLFRAVPELLVLVKGMLAAIRSVGTTILLLTLLLYVFALIFRQLTASNAVLSQLYFGSVGQSMYTLLVHGVFMDDMGLTMRHISAESFPAVLLFWGFILISSLTVMNMLIAVICEAVSSVAAAEKEALMVNFLQDRMRQLFMELDESNDGRISKEEFLEVLEKPEAVRLLAEVGLDVVALVDRVDALFMADDDVEGQTLRTLSLTEFTEAVLSLRGTSTATVRDIMDLRTFMRKIVAQTNNNLGRVEKRLLSLEEATSARNGLPVIEGPPAKPAMEGKELGR